MGLPNAFVPGFFVAPDMPGSLSTRWVTFAGTVSLLVFLDCVISQQMLSLWCVEYAATQTFAFTVSE